MEKLSIIYDTDNFAVIDKPAGLLVHKISHSKNSGETTLVDLLLKKYPEAGSVGDKPKERPGIVHRLDRETSGILVAAKTQDFFDYFKDLFQKGLVKKTYLAVVLGHPPKNGVIDKPIGIRSGSVRRSTRARNMRMVKTAITEFKALKLFDFGGKKYALLRIFPKTGRTHQIRVHLSDFGFPVVGDKLYAPKTSLEGYKRHLLHAESLEFSLKAGERVKFEAIPPEDFKGFL